MNTNLFDIQPPAIEQDNQKNQTVWGGLNAGALPIAIAKTASKREGPILVIAQNATSVEKLLQALAFYIDEKSVPLLKFPDWETLTYEQLSPHPDIISERLRILHLLPTLKAGILVVSITSLMQKLAPRQWISKQSLNLQTGMHLNLEDEQKSLKDAGYTLVDTVYAHGEYAVRGSIVDIFPMGTDMPIRIDFLDDEIESLRTFDPDSQRTVGKADVIQCLPASEIPLTTAGVQQFKKQWYETFPKIEAKKCPVYKDVNRGFASAGIEYYLPLFFEETSLLLDYIPNNTWLIMTGTLTKAGDSFYNELKERYENLRYDPERPILPPDSLFVPTGELFHLLKKLPRTIAYGEKRKSNPYTLNFKVKEFPDIAFDAHSERPAEKLITFLEKQKDIEKILFCAESLGRRERLLELLQAERIIPAEFNCFDDFIQSDERLGIMVGLLDDGALLTAPNMAILAERQLFGTAAVQQHRRRTSEDVTDQVVRNLVELKPGDAVVHVEHGVGRYQGLQNINVDDRMEEFLILHYNNETRLYVPVASLHLISRYTGADPALAPLHSLGSKQWDKARRKAISKARDVAAQLLDTYAKRAAKTGHAHQINETEYQKFVAQFPFEETPDQVAAIDKVRDDMQSGQPMDRLVCGDVGFGKTEVAMRAAFISVLNNKQVAIIVPTTLLAQQHYESLQDRFAEWPVRVDVLSRFRNDREINAVKKLMLEGSIDIVIGTHKLLQPSIRFKDLGLVIIDEEHRFGVRQKEKFKSLRAEVDILTLTATPIPRTLNMALSGLRDLSIIATPPARRLAIKTFTREYQQGLIKEAIQRELLRGGQVYYLHNKVQTIERIALDLKNLVPEAEVAVAHGQMREHTLEHIMADFYHKRINILVCTTIIETGIDIPNANTIIIDRADKFGLAQLHQLRGRVGRSHHQAYAYLLIPDRQLLTKDAAQRLEAIEAAGELGVGFTLATHDLEIRGAGELLGEEQSGEIQTVGFSLYTSMLETAVKAIKEGSTTDWDSGLDLETEIDMQISALIPDDYLPDVHTRLVLYKRIANATNADVLAGLRSEIIDRFGLLPQPTDNLFRVMAIKLVAQPLGIQRLVTGATGGWIEFSETTTVMPETLVRIIQQKPDEYSLKDQSRMRFTAELTSVDERFGYVQDLLEELQPTANMTSN